MKISFPLYKFIQHLENRSLATLVTTAIVLLSFCYNGLFAQKTVEFSFAQANVDTIGWFFQFDTPIDPPRAGENGAPVEDYELAKAVFVFLSEGGIPPNLPFDPNSVATQKLPSKNNKYEHAYAIITDNELVIRLSKYFDSGYEVYSFRRASKELIYQENTTLSGRYFTYVSRILHYQLLNSHAKNIAIQRLQSSCGSKINPYFTMLDCVVDTIEGNDLMRDPDFLLGLREVDPITYK